jgi:hypothetical protein
MNEELKPRIYREYCWFALLLLIVTVGIVDRPPGSETGARTNPESAASAAPVHQPK